MNGGSSGLEISHQTSKSDQWFKQRNNIEVGDIVLVIVMKEKRSNWRLGKVLAAYHGSDDRVRSVQIKTKEGSKPVTNDTCKTRI